MVLKLYCAHQCLCTYSRYKTHVQTRKSDCVIQAGFPTLQLSLQSLDLLFLEETDLETIPTRQLAVGTRVFSPLAQLCVESSACVLTAVDSFLRFVGCIGAQLVPLWLLHRLKKLKAAGMGVDIYTQVFDFLRRVLDSLDIVAKDSGDVQRRHDEADDGACCRKDRFGHTEAAEVREIERGFVQIAGGS
jgi:hypothetical protein